MVNSVRHLDVSVVASMSGRRVVLERLARQHIAVLHRITAVDEAADAWPLHGRRLSVNEFEDYLWELSSLQFTMLRRDVRTPVGLVQGLDENLRNGTIGVGVVVDRALWKAGWPMEGVVLFLDYLFAVAGYRKVYFRLTTPVLDRMGSVLHSYLTSEGAYRQHVRSDDGYDDLHILSLHRDQWDTDFARRITGNG